MTNTHSYDCVMKFSKFANGYTNDLTLPLRKWLWIRFENLGGHCTPCLNRNHFKLSIELNRDRLILAVMMESVDTRLQEQNDLAL